MSESELKAIWKALADLQARIPGLNDYDERICALEEAGIECRLLNLEKHKRMQLDENRAVYKELTELKNILADTRMKLAKLESKVFHFPQEKSFLADL